MFAVVKIKGKQFRVEPDCRLRVPTLAEAAGQKVTFEEVLLVSDGQEVKVGDPCVAGCSVTAEVVEHGRSRKIIVFKKKRRKNYRRKKGHRQPYTDILIREILSG